MPVFNKIYRLLIILSPLLILSCWNSSPTSDNDKAYKVSGSVIDKTGSGIEGVSVQITGTNFSITDTTGTGGAFSFNAVKSGAYKIKAMKDSCFFKPASIEFSVNNADIDTLKFTTAESYVHGRVLDIISGKGCGGVQVKLLKKIDRYSFADVGSIVTDNDGEFGFNDLEKNSYTLSYLFNYFVNYGYSYSFESSALDNREIILPDYYFSSEKLTITKAEFIKDTNTLNLEWKPSGSEYISYYHVYIFKNPEDINSTDYYQLVKIGGYYTYSSNNKDSRQIKYQDVSRLFDENTIAGEVFIGIAPIYKIGKTNYFGPCSDLIKIQLYW